MTYIKKQDIIDELVKHNKKVFNINDIVKITGKPRNYVSKILAKSKKIQRIERGKYYLTGINQPDIYELASQIVFPCYISMFAAFQFYSLTEQSILKYSVISLKRHRSINIGSMSIEFIKINKNRFFGYKKINNTYIALIEKAIVDSLYLHSPPISYVENIFSEAVNSNRINKDLLINFAIKMKSKTIIKKVYILLKQNKISYKLPKVQ